MFSVKQSMETSHVGRRGVLCRCGWCEWVVGQQGVIVICSGWVLNVLSGMAVWLSDVVV
jgi:hypothetical protein